MSYDYSKDQPTQRSIIEARDRLLPKLMGGEMDVVLENYPAI